MNKSTTIGRLKIELVESEEGIDKKLNKKKNSLTKTRK